MPLIADLWKRQKTYYALTDQRALIITTLFDLNTLSVQLKTLNGINVVIHKNGRGTITFGAAPAAAWMSSMAGLGVSRRVALPAFESIEDAQRVEALIYQAQQG